MKHKQMTLRRGITRELELVKDEAVQLARQLGFTGSGRRMLQETQRELRYYSTKLTDGEDRGAAMGVARSGPWMRKFPKPIVSRIFCLAALEVLFNPFELLSDGGFDLNSWFNEIERRLAIVRRWGPIAVKVSGPSAEDLSPIVRVKKARERIRMLEHEIAVARAQCGCA